MPSAMTPATSVDSMTHHTEAIQVKKENTYLVNVISWNNNLIKKAAILGFLKIYIEKKFKKFFSEICFQV